MARIAGFSLFWLTMDVVTRGGDRLPAAPTAAFALRAAEVLALASALVAAGFALLLRTAEGAAVASPRPAVTTAGAAAGVVMVVIVVMIVVTVETLAAAFMLPKHWDLL